MPKQRVRKGTQENGKPFKFNIAQKHITRRIGSHQRAALKRKEARKKRSNLGRPASERG